MNVKSTLIRATFLFLILMGIDLEIDYNETSFVLSALAKMLLSVGLLGLIEFIISERDENKKN